MHGKWASLFSQLRKIHLQDYVELRMKFERLTGESVKDVFGLAGKDDNSSIYSVKQCHMYDYMNIK